MCSPSLFPYGNAKREWTVAGILTIIYTVIFALIANKIIDDKLLFGFCVAGSPDLPDQKHGCGESHPLNSHMGCFVIGITALLVEIALYFMDKKRSTSRTGTYIILMFIVAVHGGLHWFLQQTQVGQDLFGEGKGIVVNCYRDFSDSEVIVLVGTIVFFIWSFFLALAFLRLATGEFTRLNSIISVILAALVVLVAWETNLQLVLPSLFVMTHLLVSYLGIFTTSEPPNDPEDSKWIFESKLVANCFIFATSAAIIELTLCPELLKPLGGHIWYDIGLALTAVTAAPYFSFPAYGKKKKD